MTAIQAFKKYGAHYYDNDEEAIILAMNEYAEAKAKEASETIEMLRQSLAQTTANRIFEKENTEKEAYNQGVRDAAESAEIKEIINNGRPPRYKINKESILKLLK